MKRFADEARALKDRSAEDALTDAESRALEARIERTLSGSRAGLSIKRVALVLAPAAAAAIALFVVTRPAPEERWYAVLEGAECISPGAELSTNASCEEAVKVAVGDDRMEFAPGTRIQTWQENGAVTLDRFSMIAGRATFEIAPRAQAPARRDQSGRLGEDRAQPFAPFRLEVSDATIIVLGTRFTVEQSTGGGSVDLEQGTIELEWKQGEPKKTVLHDGGRAEWPRRVPETATSSAGAKTEPEATTPQQQRKPRTKKPPIEQPRAEQPGVDAIMRRLFQLRSQSRYDEAVALLRDSSTRADLTRTQKERLSFELANVLRQKGDEKAACAQLRDHVRAYPESPRRAEIEATLKSCR
jgi:hypothetical protein